MTNVLNRGILAGLAAMLFAHLLFHPHYRVAVNYGATKDSSGLKDDDLKYFCMGGPVNIGTGKTVIDSPDEEEAGDVIVGADGERWRIAEIDYAEGRAIVERISED